MRSIPQLLEMPVPARLGGRDGALPYAALFVVASLAFVLKSTFAWQLGLAGPVLAIVGNVTCGWSWLATRALFRPEPARRALWPVAAVLLLMLATAIGPALPDTALSARLLDNAARLGSSAMLLLALTEPLRDLARHNDQVERRFRLTYAGGYAAILAVAVLAVDGAPAGTLARELSASIKATCAFASVIGFGLAWAFRLRHPLASPPGPALRKPVAADPRLGEELTHLMRERQLYSEAELRVADLARLTGEPEYKVTQCITGTLGFPNFNQMVNRYRIEEAKRRLADPACAHLPILTIALDCGFGSIGPFNRAFKADTQMTPQEFRRQTGLRP